MVVWGRLTNSWERKKSKRQRRKGKIYPFEFQRIARRDKKVFLSDQCKETEENILECKVKWTLGSITRNEASGSDGILAELFKIPKDNAAWVLHSICQQIWKTQEWPQDWKRSVFIPIPKKEIAKECSNYCTVALISHARILQDRLQQYINGELPDIQAGFRKGRGTRDQIANIRWIMEKAKEFQKKSTSASLTMLKPLTVWKSLGRVQLFATPWTIQSMEFSRPEYWILHQGILPTQGSKPRSPILQVDSLPAEPPGKPKNTGVGSSSLLQQIFQTKESNHGLLHCRWILYQLSYLGLCGSQQTVVNLKEMGISDYLTWVLENLYTSQEETVRTGHGMPDWFQIGKEVRQSCILSPCLFNLYAEYIMRNTRLDEA